MSPSESGKSPTINRRAAIKAAAIIPLSGCVNQINDTDENGGSNDSDCINYVNSSGSYPDLRISADSVPSKASVSICVSPTRAFSDETSAQIAIELTNVGDDVKDYGFGVSPPYGDVSADHQRTDAQLYLIPDYREHINPDEGLVPAEPTDGCWRAASSFTVEDIGLSETVAPGETIRETYTVLAAPQGECLTPGTYRTEETTYDPVGGPWGFDVTLSE